MRAMVTAVGGDQSGAADTLGKYPKNDSEYYAHLTLTTNFNTSSTVFTSGTPKSRRLEKLMTGN